MTTTTDPATMPVARALALALQEVPAVPRSGRTEQGTPYRRIDDVLAAVRPVLGRHGLSLVPEEVVERWSEQRPTRSGATINVVGLRVAYRLSGPAGDSMRIEVVGEGSDVGDKAAAKAMTAALKVALTQVLLVADEDHEAPVQPRRPTRAQSAPTAAAAVPEVGEVKAAFEQVRDPKARSAAKRAFFEQFGRPEDLGPDRIEEALEWVRTHVLASSASTGSDSTA